MALTAYNQNFGLIREVRSFNLQRGVPEIKFTDGAIRIDATSVHFKSLTAPKGTVVLEENFEYDLINWEKLLEKYVDRETGIPQRFGPNGEKTEVLKEILLSPKGSLTVKVGENIYLNPSGEVILLKLPGGLITRPTLSWLVDCERPGEHKVEVSYLTSGLKWDADYVLVSDQEDKEIDLNGWVTIENKSGATHKDAKLKLIAWRYPLEFVSVSDARVKTLHLRRRSDILFWLFGIFSGRPEIRHPEPEEGLCDLRV